MTWAVILLEEVEEWFLAQDQSTAEQIAGAIERLEEDGPNLGRPLADVIHGSRLPNLKELRPGSARRSKIRILFVFDPQRQAVLLVAGDKAGNWSRWYKAAIPLAEERYERWLVGEYEEER